MLLTLGRALKVTGGALNVVYKCSSKRCLHALEIQRPGWITRQRDKLRILSQNRKATDRMCMALGVLNGSESRRRFKRKGGVSHSASYLRAFMEIDTVLSEKNACTASRLQFVSGKFLYGRPLKEARNIFDGLGRRMLALARPIERLLWRLYYYIVQNELCTSTHCTE